jgi:predicted nucleic acid-binding protein
MPNLIALDSCSILHLLSKTPAWYPHVRRIYDDAVASKLMIVVSEVSIAECSRLEVTGAPALPPADQAHLISLFFHNTFIIRRPLTSRESEFAATLVRDNAIGTCDALVAATAVFAGATTLYTTDGCSPRRKAGKLLTLGQLQTKCGKQMAILTPDQYMPVP